MIGEHAVMLVPLSGPEVDLSCLVDEVSINHGRDDTDSQPEASSCTLNMSTTELMPPELEVGATIVVTTALVATSHVRFSGRVTDLVYGWEDAGEESPNRPVAQVTATSTLAELGRRVVGDAPFPQELDGARVARVLALAGVVLDPLTSDPGINQILARDIDSQPALEVAQDAAQSARGVVWQTRAGEVRYADSEHRRGTTPAVELDACDVLVSPAWRRTTEGLINQVSIGYGPTPEGGEQPRYVASRADSVAKYGRYGYDFTSDLAAQADAAAMGNLLLTRNSSPVWVMGALPVDVKNLDPERTEALLELDMHSLLALTGLPNVGSAPTATSLWVEGLTERLAWGEHELELVVSGFCRTVPAPRWDDLAPSQTWDAIGTLTWDDATCVGPQPPGGRWTDVPASTRWDSVPATTTWDNWEG